MIRTFWNFITLRCVSCGCNERFWAFRCFRCWHNEMFEWGKYGQIKAKDSNSRKRSSAL